MVQGYFDDNNRFTDNMNGQSDQNRCSSDGGEEINRDTGGGDQANKTDSKNHLTVSGNGFKHSNCNLSHTDNLSVQTEFTVLGGSVNDIGTELEVIGKNKEVKGENEKFDIVVEEDISKGYLLYGVMDTPPYHITGVCALQQALLSLAAQLVVSLLVAEAVCASRSDEIKARLLSSTLFMNGITTLCMSLFGIRLPLFQGAASEYVVPLLLVGHLDGTFCGGGGFTVVVHKLVIKTTVLIKPPNGQSSEGGGGTGAGGGGGGTATNSTWLINGTTTAEDDIDMDRIFNNIRMLQGSMIATGVFHALLGLTGAVGMLVNFIGPLTIVPTLILIFIFIVTPSLKFVEANWGIAFSTIIIAVILFLYLKKYNMPILVWTPSEGFRVIRYPLHQVFAILISMLLNWALCAALTAAGYFTDDKDNVGYNSRTDARAQIIQDNPWFILPYPGQYGMFSFSWMALLSCLIATFVSVLDSIGDYYACARVCRVPAPPKHAVNRGIMIEGMCSILSGTVGCGHATSTYGGNIGAVGVTRVASRQVFVGVGVLYIMFGIFGKFSAIFITIPYPVLGGAVIVMFGIFFGVVVSNLELTDMASPRNTAILGLSVFIGLCVPTWINKQDRPINTGHEEFDSIMGMMLGNPNLVGTFIAFLLDNTVPGTLEERGIAAWQVNDEDEFKPVDKTRYNEGYEVYQPIMPKSLMYHRFMRYIPFMPYKRAAVEEANGSRA